MHSSLDLKSHTSIRNSRLGIYSFVFATKASLVIVLFLLFSFFIQPFHLAYANEAAKAEEAADATDTPVAEDVRPDETDSVEVIEVSPEEESVADTVVEDDSILAMAEVSDVTDGNQNNEVIESENGETEVTVENNSTASEEVNEQLPATSEESANQVTTTDNGVTNEPTVDSSTTTESGTEEMIDDEATNATSSVSVDEPSENINDSTSTTTTGNEDGIEITDDNNTQSGGGSVSLDVDTDTATTTDSATSNDEAVTTGDSDSSGGSSSTNDTTDAGNTDSNDDTADTGVVTESSTTSIPAVKGSVNTVEYVVTDDNFYQFSKQSCVAVGGGSYHCSVTDEQVVDSKAVVYSDTGSSGSPEIFIRTSKGDVKQITDNNFEDSSPHYDPVSQRIVWQRLIQGRYQIIVYDIKAAEETQLTFSRANNMEPSVSTDGVVWQAWDNNDWEIMFYDGTYTEQITDNNTQDVAPVMQDKYIIWTVIGADEQLAQVYSLDSKETITITNYEGGSIINPRFVLVYDTQFDNGDVITQRFDPDTGFAEAIAAKPAKPPIDIPEPDSTGEVKALITTKATAKQTGVVDHSGATGGNGDGGNSNPNATSTADTLNLTQVQAVHSDTVATTTDEIVATSTVAQEEAATDQTFELTEFDLIIPSSNTASTAAKVNVTNASSTGE